MKRLGGVWQQVCAFDNLYAAWRLARRGKRDRAAVNTFALNLERELLRIQRQLREQNWRPGNYRQFTIYERKPRLISAAPFADRVVHHALMRVIEPALDRQFVDDSYACRRGRGVHLAVQRYEQHARRYAYVLKFDIARYFPSIDHRLLKTELRRRIKDHGVLWLCDRIIDHSPPQPSDAPLQYFAGDDLLTPLAQPHGIPIGNLTSQFFANLYLDRFDHWLLEQRRVGGYLRFVDDVFVFGDNKAALWETAAVCDRYLADWRLRIHPRKRELYRCTERVDVLGYRVSPHRRWLRNDNGHRFARRLRHMARQYALGQRDWERIGPSVAGWCGHARHGQTLGLQQAILAATVFRLGADGPVRKGDERSCDTTAAPQRGVTDG